PQPVVPPSHPPQTLEPSDRPLLSARSRLAWTFTSRVQPPHPNPPPQGGRVGVGGAEKQRTSTSTCLDPAHLPQPNFSAFVFSASATPMGPVSSLERFSDRGIDKLKASR